MSLQVYGNGIDKINCKGIVLPEYSNVVISAHGGNTTTGRITLCHETDSTYKALNYISKNKAINFEIFSCHAGAHLSNLTYLSKGSTLITSTSATTEALDSLQTEYINILYSLAKYDNPFIKFAAYIAIVPEALQFGIQPDKKIKLSTTIPDISIYSTEQAFNSIEDFTEEGIIRYQKSQLNSFLEFVETIREHFNQQHSEHIDNLIELLGNDNKKTDFLNQFDISNYKALMLHEASHKNNINIISKLISAGVNVNKKTLNSWTALHSAAAEGHVEIVKLLLNNGARINEKTNSGATALHSAAGEGHTETVKLLLDNGASIDEKSNDGWTALHFAANKGYAETVKLLLDNGASIDEKDSDGYSAVELALNQGYKGIAKLLMDKELEIFQTNQVKYLLTHNNQSKIALNSFESIKDDIDSTIYNKVKDCLLTLNPEGIQDLNSSLIAFKSSIFFTFFSTPQKASIYHLCFKYVAHASMVLSAV